MRLDQELVVRKLCESRTEAQELISSGVVFVNSIVCTKQTRQVNDTDDIMVTSRRQFVSRGGDKLQGVLRDVYREDHIIKVNLLGKDALDVGSSTGGFTDCLLSYGINSVDAVDVGTLQLHEKLRNDSRVTLYENTDIRNFQQPRQDLHTQTKYDIIVADLSFIKLSNVIDDIVRLSSEGAQCFLLIKPQFEVGKGNTKKGIVKDESIVKEVLNFYTKIANEKGLKSIKVYPCHIQGGEGNQEYFLYGILTR
ncbi:TlyA family RNA methyltransferase [Candidatus Gracilibacteria bacterium]|nr:TlyA family RNA methyltransferase [Candidatus Gracilibacteria bacterium]